MFDIGSTELMVIAVVALLVIGPKDLPRVLHQVGKWVSKARAMTGHFKSGLETMAREAELEEMERQWASHNDRIMADHPPLSANDMQPLPPAPAPVPDVPRAKQRRCAGSSGGRGHDPVRDLDDTRAPLLEHLVELRKRLLWCVVAIVVLFFVCYNFAEPILGMLVQPLRHAFPAGEGRLVFTELYGAFFVQVKVALFSALFCAFPLLATQLWRFVAPGLYAKEKRAFLPFLLATPVLFAAGASLAYFVVMPTAFHFLLSFDGPVGGLQQEALPEVNGYLSMVMTFLMAFGIAFLLPVLLMLVERAGLVTRAQLVSGRRYAIVLSVIVAAIATPPDALSQLMLAGPLVLLYEGTLILLWFSERRAGRKVEQPADLSTG